LFDCGLTKNTRRITNASAYPALIALCLQVYACRWEIVLGHKQMAFLQVYVNYLININRLTPTARIWAEVGARTGPFPAYRLANLSSISESQGLVNGHMRRSSRLTAPVSSVARILPLLVCSEVKDERQSDYCDVPSSLAKLRLHASRSNFENKTA